MKKIYIEPDFELINIRLLDDVLITSMNVEETLPDAGGGDFGGGFEEGGFEDLGEL